MVELKYPAFITHVSLSQMFDKPILWDNCAKMCVYVKKKKKNVCVYKNISRYIEIVLIANISISISPRIQFELCFRKSG